MKIKGPISEPFLNLYRSAWIPTAVYDCLCKILKRTARAVWSPWWHLQKKLSPPYAHVHTISLYLYHASVGFLLLWRPVSDTSTVLTSHLSCRNCPSCIQEPQADVCQSNVLILNVILNTAGSDGVQSRQRSNTDRQADWDRIIQIGWRDLGSKNRQRSKQAASEYARRKNGTTGFSAGQEHARTSAQATMAVLALMVS